MPRRSEHSREQLRALALDAVLAIAERDGPQAVSARKVAQEIGYAPGMLYYLFEGMRIFSIFINGYFYQLRVHLYQMFLSQIYDTILFHD